MLELMPSLTPDKVVEWVFYLLLSLGVKSATSSLKELKNSVNTLNVSMAVIVERISGHEKRLDDHEKRIHTLNRKHTRKITKGN